MDLISLIGLTASIFTGISLLPQLFKLIKEKEAKDISLGMLGVLLIGLGFWVWYGFLKEDWIIIISNSFSILVNLFTTVLSLLYKKRAHSI